MVVVQILLWFLAAAAFILATDGMLTAAGRLKPGIHLVSADTEYSYAVLVPIYGNTKYLTNIDALAVYTRHITLVTTTTETAEFYADLHTIAAAHHFGILQIPIETANTVDTTSQRGTTVPIRDQIIAGAIRVIDTDYVICIDADTTPQNSFDDLIATMSCGNIDVASVVLAPSGQDSLLERLQVVEYTLAMRTRRVWNWLLSGGCHAATTTAYRDIMDHHSTFFQGNDVEAGLLAQQLGYRCGHILFTARTDTPARCRDWWRQRYAWAGGEFRLLVINAATVIGHPLFFCYGTIFVMAMWVLRVLTVITHPAIVAVVYLLYAIILAVLTAGVAPVGRTRRRITDTAVVVAVFPLYALVSSLILVGLSPVSYGYQAITHRNIGRIGVRNSSTPETRAPERSS